MNDSEPILTVSGVSFGYEREDLLLQDFSLSLDFGQIITLLGPSGCGKSTLLRLIAGLARPIKGAISFGNLNQKGVGMLFQDYDAYPWLTVWNNVQKGSGPEPFPSAAAVQETIAAVGLAGWENKFPGELSGGMRKRLAIARCIVRRPSILLLDEPFASLDLSARFDMYELIQKFVGTKNSAPSCSMILVTHNIEEAVLLSDRIVVLGARPMRLRDEITVPLARPRISVAIGTVSFGKVERRLFKLLDPRQVILYKNNLPEKKKKTASTKRGKRRAPRTRTDAQ